MSLCSISPVMCLKNHLYSCMCFNQVLQDLFGLKISSLLLAHPEVSEGSADEAPPPSRVFLDLLGRHRKLQGRSRKGVGRGCFGMKVDRIGVISGLGC
uniref:Uncharacterized protein n=2 Tax=Cyprinus carpio TaxID=7962 RepID=A0A8C2ED05_CYPCA